MKYLLIAIVIGLAGCQSAPAPSVLPAPAKPVSAIPPPPSPPATPPAPASNGLEQKVRQQAQYIEALISQNDALTAKLTAANSTTPPPPSVIPLAPNAATLPLPAPVSPTPPSEPMLTPNADNVIDLAAVVAAERPGEPVNPFTVRTVPPDAMREVTLRVSGIVAGPTACAIINDRLFQSGEIVESLAIERIESDAVYLRREGQRIRLPVSEQPVRIHLPL